MYVYYFEHMIKLCECVSMYTRLNDLAYVSSIDTLSSLLFRFILHILMMHFIMQNNRNNNKNNHNEHGFYAKCQFHMQFCYSTSWSMMSLTKTNNSNPESGNTNNIVVSSSFSQIGQLWFRMCHGSSWASISPHFCALYHPHNFGLYLWSLWQDLH